MQKRKPNKVTQEPVLFPTISLAQKNKEKPVEMDSDKTYLAERINKKLAFFTDLHSTTEKHLAVHPI